MENGNQSPMDVIQSARNFLQAHKDALWRPRSSRNAVVKDRWSPPPLGVVKINFDGTLFSNPLGLGAGFVARNHEGLFCIAWGKKLFHGIVTAAHAEALAARSAIEFGVEHGWNSVIIEGDALAIVQEIQTSSENHSSLEPIIDDVKGLMFYQFFFLGG
ncbi:UNVERIFIED_CONTAM: hypothetical protein Sradi_3960600 [Sesamum radiatum]|uniref:RNase H type-1 domain-containing protein n=1 Tax=Sesamum radiatum TaxID=300843 RepID=A0AAW2PJ79_SESRA